MRFRSSLFDRSYATAPIGDLTGPARGEAGADGDQWLNDMYGGGPDVNPELSGRAKHLVYDEMRKTDATVKSLLFMPKLTIRSGRTSLTPADDTPLASLIRDMVNWNLGIDEEPGQLDLSWPKVTEQGLTMLDFGACLEELVWADARQWVDADGDSHLVRPLAKIALRPTSSVNTVTMNTDGTVKTVKQDLPGTTPIPGDKISHMLYEREGGRWDGVALLRPAWGAWRLKKFLIVNTGIGWDRFMMGIPTLWHPDTVEGTSRAKSIGRAIRGHQRAYVRLPVPMGASRADSEWDFEIKSGAGTLADPVALLKWCSDQIAEAGLQQFSRQGLGQTGARATSETQVDPFYSSCEALAHDLIWERTRQVIRKLVEVNFGVEAAETLTPRLSITKIRPLDIEKIGRALSYLSGAGFTFTDREANDDLREMLQFSRLPNDLEAQGIDRAQLEQILAQQGLDPAQLAAIVAALPDQVGVARNRVPEGTGLGL